MRSDFYKEYRMRDSMTFLPAEAGKNQGSHQFLNWWQRYATGISHLDGFESLQCEKNGYPFGYPFFGRGWGIRTPANGVRVRCATVTQILYMVETAGLEPVTSCVWSRPEVSPRARRRSNHPKPLRRNCFFILIHEWFYACLRACTHAILVAIISEYYLDFNENIAVFI